MCESVLWTDWHWQMFMSGGPVETGVTVHFGLLQSRRWHFSPRIGLLRPVRGLRDSADTVKVKAFKIWSARTTQGLVEHPDVELDSTDVDAGWHADRRVDP